MEKIIINMSYTGDKIEGQGVGAATKEQINLIKDKCNDDFNVIINKMSKYDLLHVHTIDPMSFIRMFSTRKPKVMHVHFLPETLEGSIKLPKLIMKMFQWYFLKMYRRADHIVVVNPIFIQPLTKYRIKEETIKYIPNFVSEESFYELDLEDKKRIKLEYNIPEDKFVVLGVGQVQTRKGVLDFVEVAKSLPDVYFVWAGGFSFGAITDGYAQLKEIIDNPPANVIFTDIIPRVKMNDIYNIGDLLFMPSYNELFPMAILEACSSNKALLLRDLDLYEDILFNKYLSGSNNSEFIDQISKLSKDSGYYQSAVNSSKEISKYYSRNNIKEIWKEFYTEIYNKKRNGN